MPQTLTQMNLLKIKTTSIGLFALLFLVAGCAPENQATSDTKVHASTPHASTPDVKAASDAAPAAQIEVENEVEEEFIFSLWDELGDHPLDKSLRSCVDGNAGDLGTRNCLKESLTSWKEEVAKWANAIGTQLLRGPAAEAFKDSQTAWDTYKEKEFKFIEMKYEGMSGTMYQKRMSLEKVTLVRHRGLELYGYQQALNVER